MPVYQGRDSCMARREGWFIRRIERPGVDTISEAVALAWAVLRDWRRGYTYDNDDCKKIRMAWDLAERRLRFIVRLARIHGASEAELRVIKRLVAYALRRKRLPRRIAGKDARAIVKRGEEGVSYDFARGYRWGKRSAEALKQALRRFLERGDVSELAPYLTAPRRGDCEELKESMAGLVAWEGLKWAYRPRGPPPSTRYSVLIEVLCREGVPSEEEILKALEEGEYGGEEEL